MPLPDDPVRLPGGTPVPAATGVPLSSYQAALPAPPQQQLWALSLGGAFEGAPRGCAAQQGAAGWWRAQPSARAPLPRQPQPLVALRRLAVPGRLRAVVAAVGAATLLL